MTKLHLDSTIIAACRKEAAAIANTVKTMIDSHSTSTVERTILRLLGVDGVNRFDIPYPNIVIDHIKTHADLTKGVCHYLTHAIDDTGLSPQAIAEHIASKKLSLASYTHHPKPTSYEPLLTHFHPMKKHIDAQRQTRAAYRQKTPAKTTPDAYVIVATGNIYEDIEQAVSAAKNGADIIAVIRTTGQSLLDYVPYGATTEGFGGTYATQENFRLMRQALDALFDKEKRYIRLVNYASGLCMPEIVAMGAIERLDMMLNDSLYGIIFRDINMKRTLIDQYFSRVLSAYADITINTGEDNYLTTADAFDHAHTVIASQFINEQFAKTAYMKAHLMGLGHAYEIDPAVENSFLYEMAQAQLSRELFPDAPLKYMPPTKHMTGDIFKGTIQNTLFNITAVTTKQNIHLLGMLTEAIHTPFMSDRALALDNAKYIARAFKDFGDEIVFKPEGVIVTRAKTVLANAHTLLEAIKEEGLFKSLEKGVFADISRSIESGKGLDGVFVKHADYANPIIDDLIESLKEETA